MLDGSIIKEIQKEVQTFWELELQKEYFIQTAQGKEIGHRIADLVDDKTTGWLAVHYDARFQRDRHGNKLPRSMGDIWLRYNEIFHPINVKTGISSQNGQPNMVALKKILDALLNYQVDSYYLLMVKIEMGSPITCSVHFVDMLDYLDYMTFDSGPGQIMLKARMFFKARAENIIPPLQPIEKKVIKLFDMLEDGDKRLADNRKRLLDIYRDKATKYVSSHEHKVTPKSQEILNLR